MQKNSLKIRQLTPIFFYPKIGKNSLRFPEIIVDVRQKITSSFKFIDVITILINFNVDF